jgi:hypothetical protein
MPTITKVRDGGVWKTPVVFWVRDGGVWKKVGSLQARVSNTWSAPQVWAPNPPTLVQPTNTTEYDKTTLTWSAATGAPVKYYEVRQTKWDAAHTTPVATVISPPVTGLSTSMAVSTKTYYSYNVRAVSTDDTGNVPSAYSNTVRWRIGNPEASHQVPVGDWDPRIDDADVPHWATYTNYQANAQHPQWWAFNGEGVTAYYRGDYGWIIYDGSQYGQIDATYIYGKTTGIDSPWIQANPPNRVLITHVRVCHLGNYGWKFIYGGAYRYSLNRQHYIIDTVDTNSNQKSRFLDFYLENNAGGAGDWPSLVYADSSYRHGGNQQLEAGEGLRIYVSEWAPTNFINDYAYIPRSSANIVFVRLWYHNWNPTHHYNKVVDELAVGNTTWS